MSRGDWHGSFLWNPLMPVYVLLLVYSTATLLYQLTRAKRLHLHPIAAWIWCSALLIGFIAKLAIGPKYW